MRRIHCHWCHSRAAGFTVHRKAPAEPTHKQCLLLLKLLQTSVFPGTRNHLSLCSDGEFTLWPTNTELRRHHQTPPKCSSPEFSSCRHSCAIEAGQGVMQVSKILRPANCLVTILCTVQSGFWLRGVVILSSLGRESYKNVCTWGVSREIGRLRSLSLSSLPNSMLHVAHFFFSSVFLPSPITLYNMSSKSAKHASSKANRKQANKFL